MKIDYKNKEIIRSRDVYVHDSTFEGFTYHEEQQKLSFRMKKLPTLIYVMKENLQKN